jgi:hypothetical protein
MPLGMPLGIPWGSTFEPKTKCSTVLQSVCTVSAQCMHSAAQCRHSAAKCLHSVCTVSALCRSTPPNSLQRHSKVCSNDSEWPQKIESQDASVDPPDAAP